MPKGAGRERRGFLRVLIGELALACLLTASLPSFFDSPVRSGFLKDSSISGPMAANFVDIAGQAGLNARTVIGGVSTKEYILETTGGGVALIDYDNDGWLDIFLVNGSRLEGFRPGEEPTNHLFRNNHDGTFTDVTPGAGL